VKKKRVTDGESGDDEKDEHVTMGVNM